MLRLLEEKIITPLDPLWVTCGEQSRLRTVEWEEYDERMVQLLDIHYRKEGYERISAANPGGLSDELSDYFADNLGITDTFPTATGGTPFQHEIWETLRTIPCGQVMHYGQLTEQLGRSGVTCVIGTANGSNPINVAVPCHRVIDRNGTMTGCAGEVQRKEWLSRHGGYLLLQTLNNLCQLIHTFM